ncbi:MAG TPA: methyltransferase domain-containing protein [Gemmataceae bacterium]|nr:methyltransferase domain-containing protein [Gemmataceae bacterium]
MPELRHYGLQDGEAGAERLRLLARAKWPTTQTLLAGVGLRQGMHCLDVGCGIGEVALALAEWVGPRGRVVGIDVNDGYLAVAREQAARRGLGAVFRRGDVFDLHEEAAYDLVYARFVLTHLSEPARALHRLLHAARPGGAVVVEDIDFPGHFCYPDCAAFRRYVELYEAVVRRHGGDPAIGPRLLGLMRGAGLGGLHLDVVLPTFFEGEGKRVAVVTLQNIRQAVEEAGLATPAEIDATITELDAFTRDPNTILSMPRIFQVWGRRPAASPVAPGSRP